MRRSTAKKVKPHVAALRRHARALSGGQSELAERTLQGVRDKDYRSLARRDVRARLFRDFHDLHAAEASPDPAAATDRHGLMLRHAQGFSIQEVSDILRHDVLDMQSRLEQAYCEMHRQPGADLLLVQQDAVLASAMTEAIESMGHRVLGIANDHEEALATARAIRIDAVVMDLSGAAPRRDERSQMDRLLGGIDAPAVIVADGQIRRSDIQPAYLVTTPFQTAELKVMLNQALHNRA